MTPQFWYLTTQVHCHECPVNCDAIAYKVSTSRLGIGNDLVFQTLKDLPGWQNKSRGEIEGYLNLNIVGFRIGFKTLENQVGGWPGGGALPI